MVLDACYSAASIESGDFKLGPMGNPGLGQLAYDKRIRLLTASQATEPAGEAGALGMGYFSYALVKSGLEGSQADWQPKDGAIWLREWLRYGVERVTPALFDFRTEQDGGLRLKYCLYPAYDCFWYVGEGSRRIANPVPLEATWSVQRVAFRSWEK
jgi:hypothetical protein